MRVKGPIDCSSVNVGGHPVEVVDGIADVPDDVGRILVESHGFHALDADGQRIGEVALRPSSDDPNEGPILDVDLMPRQALFAALIARGVAVAVPVTSARLREMLLDTMTAPKADKPPAKPGKPQADQPPAKPDAA